MCLVAVLCILIKKMFRLNFTVLVVKHPSAIFSAIEKFTLNFPLLADVDHEVAEAYGVWKEKVNFGVKALGIVRSSFLIDEAGRVIDLWRKVKAAEHVGWVVARLGL